MSFDEEMNRNLDKVIGMLQINMQAKAQRTSVTLQEYIATLRQAGIADSVIRQNLTQDLNEGGRIFGEFFRGLGADVTGRLGELSRAASGLRFGFKNTDSVVWIAVSIQEGDKACPDCTPRHGEVDTYQGWVSRGLPKTGWSVCRTHCRCVLMKESDTLNEESLSQPVTVNKGE